MARKIKFQGTVGATLNLQSLRVGDEGEKISVAARKMIEATITALAVNGWQCVIVGNKDGEVTIADRDNPKMQGVLKMSILGYPALVGTIGEVTNDDGNRVVLQVK